MAPALLLLAALLARPEAGSLEQLELLLERGRVVAVRDIGQGVTGSQRVELEAGGQRLRAIFKTIDSSGQVEFRFGTETVSFYRDSYQHEIAAFELDRLLGMDLVPITVERRIRGKRGSLQQWVEERWRRVVHRQPPPGRQQADDSVHAVRLLDYLLFNIDRHFRNLAFGPNWQPIVIDHSLAFFPFTHPSRPLYRFPREPIERLRALDGPALTKALGRHLKGIQLRALEERRRIVLELVEATVAARGSEETLFDWRGPR